MLLPWPYSSLNCMEYFQTDTHLDSDAVWRFQALAKEHSLSAYDAAYLELAQRKGTGLAPLDKHLTNAARKAGVNVPHL